MMLVSQQKRHSSLHFGAVNILTHLHVGSDVFPKLLKSTDSDFSAIFFAIISPSIRINLHMLLGRWFAVYRPCSSDSIRKMYGKAVAVQRLP